MVQAYQLHFVQFFFVCVCYLLLYGLKCAVLMFVHWGQCGVVIKALTIVLLSKT